MTLQAALHSLKLSPDYVSSHAERVRELVTEHAAWYPRGLTAEDVLAQIDTDGWLKIVRCDFMDETFMAPARYLPVISAAEDAAIIGKGGSPNEFPAAS